MLMVSMLVKVRYSKNLRDLTMKKQKEAVLVNQSDQNIQTDAKIMGKLTKNTRSHRILSVKSDH